MNIYKKLFCICILILVLKANFTMIRQATKAVTEAINYKIYQIQSLLNPATTNMTYNSNSTNSLTNKPQYNISQTTESTENNNLKYFLNKYSENRDEKGLYSQLTSFLYLKKMDPEGTDIIVNNILNKIKNKESLINEKNELSNLADELKEKFINFDSYSNIKNKSDVDQMNYKDIKKFLGENNYHSFLYKNLIDKFCDEIDSFIIGTTSNFFPFSDIKTVIANLIKIYPAQDNEKAKEKIFSLLDSLITTHNQLTYMNLVLEEYMKEQGGKKVADLIVHKNILMNYAKDEKTGMLNQLAEPIKDNLKKINETKKDINDPTYTMNNSQITKEIDDLLEKDKKDISNNIYYLHSEYNELIDKIEKLFDKLKINDSFPEKSKEIILLIEEYKILSNKLIPLDNKYEQSSKENIKAWKEELNKKEESFKRRNEKRKATTKGLDEFENK